MKSHLNARLSPLHAGLALCGALLLAACGDGAKQIAADQLAAKNAAASAAKQHASTAADQTSTMVQAATSGKATAPMQLKFELAAKPLAGQTVVVSLALIAGVPAQSVAVHFGDSPGLVFANPADWTVGAVVPDTVYREDIQLSGAAAGVYFVTATATMTHDAVVETRDFSIPVIVSAP